MDLKKTKELNNDGHYSETKSGMRVAYTRCWNWQKGFRGDPRAHQRMENTLVQSVPQAVSEAIEAGSAASVAPRPVPAPLPTNSGSRVRDTVLHSLDAGDFDRILTAESVLRNIPRGLCTHPDDPAWLSCRYCLRNGRKLKIPNELGVTHHFLQSRDNPMELEPGGSFA